MVEPPRAEGATPGSSTSRRILRLLGPRTSDPLGANYYKLWIASAVSNLGDGVRLTALPLLAATLTRDPGLISGLTLTTYLPWLLFALHAGALVDRLDRRRAMGAANISRTLLVGALGAAVMTDVASIYLLYAIGFLMGVAETVFDNASQAVMPSLVRRDQLERANGRLYAAEIVTNQFMGPPLGGFLFALAAAVPFFLDSVSFAVSVLLVLSFAGAFRTERRQDEAASIRADIAEGLRWLWNHRLIRALAIMLGVWNALDMAGTAIFVLFALEILDLSEIGYGVLLSLVTVGSLIGSFLAPRLSKLGAGTTLVMQIVLGALGALAIALTSSAIVAGAAFVTRGITVIVWNVITVSLRQQIIPDRLLGRVNSVYRLAGWGSIPIGAGLGGLLAEGFGLRAPFFVQAAGLLVMAVVALPLLTNSKIARARAEAEQSA